MTLPPNLLALYPPVNNDRSLTVFRQRRQLKLENEIQNLFRFLHLSVSLSVYKLINIILFLQPVAFNSLLIHDRYTLRSFVLTS